MSLRSALGGEAIYKEGFMVLGSSNLLVGRAAQINFGQVLTGRNALRFGKIPAGTYPIGHKAKQYTVEKPFGVQTTPFTQSQFLAVREALGDQNHLVMALLPNNRQAIVARGTKAAIEELSPETILGIAREHLVGGGFITHEVQMKSLHLRLRPEWEDALVDPQFLGDDYPAYASQYMAMAIAALSEEGDRLPTSAEWEVAAGDLREERYFHFRELIEVAVFGRDVEGPTTVGTKQANNFGLHDMLGLVSEHVAEEGLVHGGFWGDFQENVSVAVVGWSRPDDFLIRLGFRLLRPHQTTGGQAQDSQG